MWIHKGRSPVISYFWKDGETLAKQTELKSLSIEYLLLFDLRKFYFLVRLFLLFCGLVFDSNIFAHFHFECIEYSLMVTHWPIKVKYTENLRDSSRTHIHSVNQVTRHKEVQHERYVYFTFHLTAVLLTFFLFSLFGYCKVIFQSSVLDFFSFFFKLTIILEMPSTHQTVELKQKKNIWFATVTGSFYYHYCKINIFFALN